MGNCSSYLVRGTGAEKAEVEDGLYANQSVDIKVMTILGTHPEIIRLSAYIKACDRYFDHQPVHTGWTELGFPAQRGVVQRTRTTSTGPLFERCCWSLGETMVKNPVPGTNQEVKSNEAGDALGAGDLG